MKVVVYNRAAQFIRDRVADLLLMIAAGLIYHRDASRGEKGK